ncbi:MAG TPA: hypothetical protein VKJ77_01120 [Caballeronia sp.]|jgi:hypothetical protein|nr:hypothetical protein [Caballeronia sp.]
MTLLDRVKPGFSRCQQADSIAATSDQTVCCRMVYLIGGLIESQAAEPIERITQRPEAGSRTALPPASD